ncbi:MAG: (E)-4-hydroxy-3-methylbut-2-enyl-diphosphate synthase [Deltaproteobacteria bacterium]|nr:(E)-4-hydroxy-3-methylbut-2-enyl-diphosphate synthase [Deltaproteobacteria bacterium]
MYRSNQINIGSLSLGGDAPIRLQSMTNTDTLDVKSSVAQVIRIIEAGGDMVRLTTQGMKEAEALAIIKKEVWKAGFDTPLIADVHFNPEIAEFAAGIVAKVRINPGNYVDKRATFQSVELSDKEYEEELERIHRRLLPLINKCIAYGTAIRIGVNHGSLSDRIMTRYGNTPEGMAVSAMEFIRIMATENFHKLVLSMKSSNSLIMIEASKLLVRMMQDEGYAYPLHLGVTEAGEGEDGRIRSALGIGALLRQGIGDTIRVSLSEPPEAEIPVARMITSLARISKTGPDKSSISNHTLHLSYNINDPEELTIKAAVDSSIELVERRAAELEIDNGISLPAEKIQSIKDGILQAARIKITRNDYISCPTCGRTKYDLATAVEKVKKATSHLKGLKIAIMGCIVNGPGEMADADYGYIGSANGKVNIYKGREPVFQNIPENEAIDKLLQLIEEDRQDAPLNQIPNEVKG